MGSHRSRSRLHAFAAAFSSAAIWIGAGGCGKTADASASIAGAALPEDHAAAAGSSAIDEAAYQVKLNPVGPYRKGEKGVFEVELKTKGDYHVNEEYPVKFKVPEKPASGISYPVPRLERLKDADAFVLEGCPPPNSNKCVLRLKVPFTPQTDGKSVVGGTLNVGVCSADKCLIERAVLELPVTVAGK